MASFFGSPPFLSHPLTRTHHFSSSSQTPPPPPPQNPPSQPQTPPPVQPLSATSSEQPTPVSAKVQQQKPVYLKLASSATKVESTDWIATTLTRRFGLGAGLAWVGFLAFGVISEQIKTRFEVSQQEANTRF